MEKIQRLADDCWLQKFHLNEDGAHDYYEFDYEKFARLIVDECAAKLESDGMGAVAMEIKEHFGVSNET